MPLPLAMHVGQGQGQGQGGNASSAHLARAAPMGAAAGALMVLAMELAAERSPRPLFHAIELGAWHGAWTIAVGSVPAAAAYTLRYGAMELPWASLAAQLGTFIAVAGALYGAGIALGEALAQRARVARSLVRVVAPAMGGALFGLAPGAFAAERFGRMSAPYFGTLEILIIGVLAFFLLGATLLRAEGVPSSRVLPALGLSLVAPLLVALTLWAIAPGTAWVVDALVLDTADMAPSLAIFGAGFGAFIGALFGALLGIARALLERYDPDRRVLGPRSSSPLTLGRGGRSRGSA